MKVETLKFHCEDGTDLTFSYEDNELKFNDSILGDWTFDRGEAHLLYLYLKERFEG